MSGFYVVYTRQGRERAVQQGLLEEGWAAFCFLRPSGKVVLLDAAAAYDADQSTQASATELLLPRGVLVQQTAGWKPGHLRVLKSCLLRLRDSAKLLHLGSESFVLSQAVVAQLRCQPGVPPSALLLDLLAIDEPRARLLHWFNCLGSMHKEAIDLGVRELNTAQPAAQSQALGFKGRASEPLQMC
jgi:hypothetical protein